MNASGFSFSDLQRIGLAGLVNAIIAENPGETPKAGEIARLLIGRSGGPLGAAESVASDFLRGDPIDAAEANRIISDALAGVQILEQALSEAAGLIAANPGTIDTVRGGIGQSERRRIFP